MSLLSCVCLLILNCTTDPSWPITFRLMCSLFSVFTASCFMKVRLQTATCSLTVLRDYHRLTWQNLHYHSYFSIFLEFSYIKHCCGILNLIQSERRIQLTQNLFLGFISYFYWFFLISHKNLNVSLFQIFNIVVILSSSNCIFFCFSVFQCTEKLCFYSHN